MKQNKYLKNKFYLQNIFKYKKVKKKHLWSYGTILDLKI